MIKAYCYGVFADTMTDEEFYEVEKAESLNVTLPAP